MLQHESQVGKTESVNKATGEIIGSSPLNSVEHVYKVIKKAGEAQEKWKNVSVAKRAELIKKASSYIADHCDELAKIISDDNGKTRVDALISELLPCSMAARYYSKKSKKFLKNKFLFPGNILLANKVSKITRVPFGVLGIISPWNYPFAIPFSEVVMGLLAGNAVILKTATETQMVGRALENIFNSIGLPENVFNYVNIPGRLAGDAFIEGGVDKLFFTGSVGAGKYLMEKAAKRLTPVSLELGGNDAMLVCEDADAKRAADGAVWAGFQNAGQSCGGVERIYVHENIYDEFMENLNKRTSSLRVGFDEDFNVDIGVMTTKKQVETVERHIEDALEKGAEISSKAEFAEKGKWNNLLAPVVLENVSHDMLVMKEETFGPVVGVMKVSSMEEAVKLANDSDLGLTGSVWCRDKKRGLSIAGRIKAGAVTINDHLMSHGLAETPWGGFKESGIGRTHGELGFQEMTEPQVIVNDIMPLVKRNMWWHPHDKRVYNGIKGTIVFLYGSKMRNRALGFLRLMRLFVRSFIR